MKKLKHVQLLALAVGLMLFTGNVWGQETIFHECVPTFTEIPSGWTSDQGSQSQTIFQSATGGYLLVNADDAWVITSAYDLSGYSDVELNVDIASYGGGVFNPLRIDVSNDDGATWTHQTFNTNVTTGTTYQTEGPFSVTATGTQVKFRFWREASSGRGVRFRNIHLTGNISSGTPLITVSPSTLTGFTYVEGSGPSAEQSFTVEGSDLTANIVVTPPSNYEISETSGSGFTSSPITLTQTGGSVAETTIWVRLKAGLAIGVYNNEDVTATSTGAADKTVTCSGEVTAPPPPTITVDPTTLTGFSYVEGNGPSAEQTFTIVGENLTSDVSISASTNYEISKTSGSDYNSPLTFTPAEVATPQTIYVRLKAGLAIGTYNNEDITATSTGADSKTVTCSGSVTDPNLNVEDFANSNATSSYADGSFIGNNGITWNYIQSRDANNDANGSGIDLPALMLRRVSDNSAVYSNAISGGIGNFSVKLYKGFTGAGNRQVELLINDISQGTSTPFDDFDEHIFEINDINITGDIIIRINNITSTQVIVDDITWTPYSTGNEPPSIANVIQNPSSGITSTTTVSVSADVTAGDADIETVELQWNTTNNFDAFTIINMTLDDGNTYVSDTEIPQQSEGTTVYYRIWVEDEDDMTALSAVQSYEVRNPRTTDLPYTENFGDDLGDMYVFTIEGAQPWFHNSSGWAEVNGFQGEDTENHWLILPGINMDDYDEVNMTFDTQYDFGSDNDDNFLKLLYSINYAGVGTPANADWSILSFTKPETFGTWVSSGILDISHIEGTAVWLAFEYKSTDEPRRWRVDNINVYDPTAIMKPSEHPTDFTATPNSSTAITVTWTDADPAADGYLIKGSAVGFEDITPPIDGEVEADDLLVKNIDAGEELYQFTGLTPNTEYFFLIFPYNGAGTTINYKTDDAPEAQATTDAPPGLPYAQDFSGFVSVETLPEDWTLDDTYSYIGDFGFGTAGGLRGNGVLGFQLTASGLNSNFTTTLSLINNTGEEINELYVKYTGLVARVDQTGTPKWIVSVNGVEYPELEYLTADGVSKDVFAIISGLSIADNALIEIEWFTTSTGTSGVRRQIGITDVEIEVPVEYNGITNPELLPPDATVTIAGNQTLEVPLQVKNLIVEDGNSLIIAPVGTLTVTGVIGNNAGVGGLLIESSAAGTGSLIHSTPGLQGISQRFIPAHGAKSATGWHFLSSPVNNFAIGSSDFEPETNDDFYAWDEGTNTWLNYKIGSNNITNFINGEGYLVAYQNDLTGVFTGTFNVGDVEVDLNLTPTKDDFNGWNLLGNPYPSAIDWSVVGNHTETFEDVFAYVWDRDKDGGAGYTYIDGREPNAFIPANQGFFVKTKAAGSFTFKNDMRAHGDAFMKSSPADDRIVLRFAGDHHFDRTTLRIRKESQFSRDWLDALKLYSFDNDVPQIYTVTTDQRGVAINSIPTVDESLTIPVRLHIPANGPMTISADEITGQFEHHTVVLFDQKTGINHKLSETPVYSFTASIDDTDRFLLKFEAVSVHEIGEMAAMHIYSHGNTLYLNSRESLDARIAVYNITGQQVHGQRMAIDGHSAINLNLPTGWYVVTVTTDKEMTTQKVFIR